MPDDGPRRPWPSPGERALIYKEQLSSIRSGQLRRRFLEEIAEYDRAAWRLMR